MLISSNRDLHYRYLKMAKRLTPEQKKRVKFLLAENAASDSFSESLQLVETSSEIHDIAVKYVWDCEGEEKLVRLLNHPLCDKGTALQIYWRGEPAFFAGLEDINVLHETMVNKYKFLKVTEEIYLADNFGSNELQYDPMERRSGGYRQCLAKYSGIPDELLIRNYGDLKNNLKEIEACRNNPVDLQDTSALHFLAATYYRNQGNLKKALDSAGTLVTLSGNEQSARQVKNLVLDDLDYQFNYDSKSAASKYGMSIEEFRNTQLDFLQNESDILNKEISGGNDSSYLQSKLKSVTGKLADLHEKTGNADAAEKKLNDRQDGKAQAKSAAKKSTAKKKKAKPKRTKEQRDIDQAIHLFLWAHSHNRDDGHEELNRILKWKTCDAGTVSQIYWGASPEFFRQYNALKEVPQHARSNWRFIHKLEKKLLAAEMPAVIRFDPASIRSSYDNLKDKFVRELPPEVYKVTPGIYDAADILSGKVGPLALVTAVSANDTARIQTLLDEGVDINFHAGVFYTPLIAAVKNKSVELIELLLGNGADVNTSAFDNESALHHAREINITKLLLDNGANVDSISIFGTVIHRVAGSLSDDYEDGMLELFLESGATPDKTEYYDGTTALHSAAYAGHVSNLKLLLKAGWNINRVDKDVRNALHHAVSAIGRNIPDDTFDRGDMVEELVKLGVSADKEDNKGVTPRTLAKKNASDGLLSPVETDKILSVLDISV